ncbi:MAG: hypothetical protein Q8N44_18500 [Rubrivivax sp.]|nr:hypothetical protein [Rubrivivax sp.]MDP3085662.1 hypothetical protein [Rubrivivax sp.]
MSNGLHFTCVSCGDHLHGAYVSLCRNVERTDAISEFAVETTVSDSEQVGTWCLGCGETGAAQRLTERGIAVIPAETDPRDRLCSRCHGPIVWNADWHVAYSINEELIEGGSISVVEARSVSPICSACDKQVGAA